MKTFDLKKDNDQITAVEMKASDSTSKPLKISQLSKHQFGTVLGLPKYQIFDVWDHNARYRWAVKIYELSKRTKTTTLREMVNTPGFIVSDTERLQCIQELFNSYRG